MTENTRQPNFSESFIPIIVLIALLVFNGFVFEDATSGPNQISLLIGAIVATVIGMRQGFSLKAVFKGMFKSLKSAFGAILILLVIGALSGAWMISGVVPTMIYYGLDLLDPSFFLMATCVICAIVALATGSSWSTIATVGIALLGIGKVMGISEGMVAGAIISGAYFGDKMSPLSDTTNLAPAMAGTDLFTHIRYMMYTTVPTLIITLIIFLCMGLSMNTKMDIAGIVNMQKTLGQTFVITPWLFLVPAVVIAAIIMKLKALPALILGTVAGLLAAFIAQPNIVNQLSGISDNFFFSSTKVFFNTVLFDSSIETGSQDVNDLLSTSGMYGMFNTIYLVVCSMCFGGAMEVTGMLKKITSSFISKIESAGSLIAKTAGTCIFFNATTSDQYLAIVVPGRMFSKEFEDRGLKPENLSRTLEDSGTVTSPLIPWNTCGAYHAGVLGVATGSYWMFCFFNLISPIMTMIYGFLNIRIRRFSKEEMEAIKRAEAKSA
ncbi:MAG: Na+/H+ antiporter NhaC [Crocinitomicaceae bacterium]|tara:strand:- start:6248 stop:7726 length:1479 start_codon:yes stop_codon:yes gene_type:complete